MDGKSCVSVAIGFIAAHYTKKTRSCGNAPYSVAVGFDDCGDELRDAVLDLAHKGGAHPKSRRRAFAARLNATTARNVRKRARSTS